MSDCRDIAAMTPRWWKSMNETKETIRVDVCYGEGSSEDLEDELSEKAYALIDEEGCVELPMRYEVCDLCGGKGHHVNPAVDSNGITEDEWYGEWDEEDREFYLSGGYDVECYECGGRRVVPEVDERRLSTEMQEILEVVDKQRRLAAQFAREEEYERRMGY